MSPLLIYLFWQVPTSIMFHLLSIIFILRHFQVQYVRYIIVKTKQFVWKDGYILTASPSPSPPPPPHAHEHHWKVKNSFKLKTKPHAELVKHLFSLERWLGECRIRWKWSDGAQYRILSPIIVAVVGGRANKITFFFASVRVIPLYILSSFIFFSQLGRVSSWII